MDWKKLLPWNWFKKEEDEAKIPVSIQSDRSFWAPSPIFELSREFDRWWNSLFRSLMTGEFGRNFTTPSLFTNSTFFKPMLDLSADDNKYLVSIEIPGVNPSDIKVEVRDQTLIIAGEKQQEQEVNEREFYRVERSYGRFRRILSLPEDADSKQIEANYKNGVLTITIPRLRLPDREVRYIEVKTS